jgi:hypothetical protein
MKITKGFIWGAQKIVVYGPEGIGKSTFASKFPNPLFIDTEGSTKNMDVARLPKPESWEMLKQEIDYIIANPYLCDTLIIDTIDWAEQLCINAICEKHEKTGIEDFGYGNGYVYEKEDFGKFLNHLDRVIEIGVNVVLTAHAHLRKFSQPDEIGEYDRWELKLGKKTGSQISPMVKEWADAVLFVNYKTVAVATDKDGKKYKAQGGTRVMYTQHHPCWDAKNRWGLPEECTFDYNNIAIYLPPRNKSAEEAKAEAQKTAIAEPVKEPKSELPPVDVSGLPKALADLMQACNVEKHHIQTIIAQKGYFPANTPLENLPEDFVSQVLVAAWEQVFQEVQKLDDYHPFYN